MQIVLIVALLVSIIQATEDYVCKVDDRIMFAIAKIEKHRTTPVGYPFLISINAKKDQKTARKIPSIKKYFLDSRTLDCGSKTECVSVLEKLNQHGITNLDCGAYQINYKYWSMRKPEYFDIQKSYFKACEIVMSHNRTKWSWENIAKYHSKTKKYNEKYKKYLIATIEKNIGNEH
jgi:hypothetical protein